MEGEFASFLLKRIGKKLGDVMDSTSGEELAVHVDDIQDYVTQLTHLLTECIAWFF